MSKLLEPIQVGTMSLKNRIVMPAMETAHNNADGSISQRMIDYFAERAIGGVGMIVSANTAIERKRGRSAPGQPVIDSNHMIAGLADLAEAIQTNGAAAVLQLGHGGRQAHPECIPGEQPVAPSAIASSANGIVPKELTIEEIKEIQEAWAKAAIRGKKAGFDGVEIHGAHGYLISSFMSPRSNKRSDIYGGSFENRARFVLEVIEQVRYAVGDNFTVGFRLSGDEFLPDGLSQNEAVEFAKLYADTGKIDYLSVSGATYESIKHMFPVMYEERGHLIHLSEAVKKVVKNIPVIGVGSLDVHTGEKALLEGKADLIAIGRGHIADPHLVNKLAAGQSEDIRPCILCNEGCLDRIFMSRTVRCSVNPAVSREATWNLTVTDHKKKVLVVGGGIAGMEAASAASKRGHEVTLVEKDSRLGGLLNEASAPDYKQPLKDYLEWAKRQIEKSNVTVKLNTEATPELLKEVEPDAIIMATGSAYAFPSIEGATVTAKEVLEDQVSVGRNVVIIGGGVVGCETALHVAKKGGKNVRIIEMQDDVLLGFEALHREVLLDKLVAAGVEINTNFSLKEINDKSVICGGPSNQISEFAADTVVLCTGLKPRKDLEKMLTDFSSEVHVIGDCAGGARIYDAVEDAWRAVMKI